MKHLRALLFSLTFLAFFAQAHAQSDQPLVIVMNADGPIEPAMQSYIERGIRSASQQNAEVLIIQLNTPGGSIGVMQAIVEDIRNSKVPVVVYVAPNGAWAGSAGSVITLAGHVAAMAPETMIGAASPVGSGGAELPPTIKTKETEALAATVRSLTERRGTEATQLAESMITNAKAVSVSEAYKAKLIDFIATDVNDLIKQLDGFKVTMSDGPRTLHTANATVVPLNMSFIEQLLLILTDSNIVFALLSLGVLALQIELSHPGTWVSGFFGVVCLTLAIYGLGVLPVNWFGLVFLILAFVLFILDIKAPTHGALTTAGVVSFIVSGLVLFNSPGTPQFERVSVPLVIGIGIFFGLIFFTVMMFAIRAQHGRIQTGSEALLGKRGTARIFLNDAGQVQVGAELWSADKSTDSDPISKGDRVEVVEVNGLRLKVRKTK